MRRGCRIVASCERIGSRCWSVQWIGWLLCHLFCCAAGCCVFLLLHYNHEYCALSWHLQPPWPHYHRCHQRRDKCSRCGLVCGGLLQRKRRCAIPPSPSRSLLHSLSSLCLSSKMGCVSWESASSCYYLGKLIFSQHPKNPVFGLPTYTKSPSHLTTPVLHHAMLCSPCEWIRPNQARTIFMNV